MTRKKKDYSCDFISLITYPLRLIEYLQRTHLMLLCTLLLWPMLVRARLNLLGKWDFTLPQSDYHPIPIPAHSNTRRTLSTDTIITSPQTL